METKIKREYLKSSEEKNKYSPFIKRISSLDFDRFIKPCNFVLTKNNGLIKSYDFNVPIPDEEKISLMDRDKLVEELRLLRKDIGVISSDSIILEGLDTDNIVVSDNKIFIHSILGHKNTDDPYYVGNYNNVKLNELIGFKMIVKENDDMSKALIEDRLYSTFLSSSHAYIEDFIKEEIKEDNLRLYLKKK